MAYVLINQEVSEEARLADYRFNVVNFRGDNAYQTGGRPGLAAILGFREIVALVALSHGGYVWDYDPGTDRLKVYQQSAATSALTEVPNATNLGNVTFRALAIGQ